MTREQALRVILHEHISEKVARQSQRCAQHTFRIARDANKGDVRRAIQLLFDAEVESVRVVNVKGRRVFTRFGRGRRDHWKKAYVSLRNRRQIRLSELEE